MADRQRLKVLHFIFSVVNIALGVEAGVFQYEVPVYKAPYVVNPPVKILPYVSDISSHFQQPLFIKSFQPAPYLYHNLQPLVYTSPLPVPFHLPVYNQPSQQNYQQQNFGGYGGGGYQNQVQNQNHQGPPQIEDSYSPNYRGAGDNGYNNYDNNNFNNQGGGYNSPSNNYNFQPNQNQYNNNNNFNNNNNINPYEEPSNSRHRLDYPNPIQNQNQNQYAGAGFNGSPNLNGNINNNNNHLNTDSAYNNNGFLQGISTSSRPPISASVDVFEQQQSPEIFEGNNFAQSFDGSEISEPFDPSTNTFDYSNFGPSGGFGDATPTAGTGTGPGTGTGTGPSPSQTSSFSPNFGEYGPVSASGQTLGLGGFPLSSPSNTASVVEKFEKPSGESSKVGAGTGSERVEKVSPAPPKSNALKQSTPTEMSPVKKSAPTGGGYSSLSSSEEDTVSIESTEDEKGNKYKNKESISSSQTEERNAEAKTQSRSSSQLSGYGNDKNNSKNNNLRSTGGKSTATASSGRGISSGNGLRKPVSLVFGQRLTPFIRASANTNTSRISNRSILKMYVPLTRKI